eukprot:TRINITY_DN34915_c0_g1_i1.p1 TRINITY_DN34915_c0_g1~~TRINITY_DN34915_c0_g1_i1.p1  ORF type:complete len:495 (-),score=61.61 TRINITY_DN34915_c0_g1_i1:75-1559(-)
MADLPAEDQVGIRGCTMSRLLLHTGLITQWRLWRTGIDGLPLHMKEKLFNLSSPTERLDIFLSHSWETPGWLKILHLQLRWGCLSSVLMVCLVHLIIFLLACYGFLPRGNPDWLAGWTFTNGESIIVQHTPWCTFTGPIVALLALLGSPMTLRCRTDPTCFFDAVSICQHDDTLKRSGISNLEAVLANTGQLHVMWSEAYLTRLWCVMELAAFLSRGTSLVVAPIAMELVIFQLILTAWFSTAAYFVLDSLVGLDNAAFPGAARMLATVPMFFAFHELRRTVQGVRKQLDQLRTFDVEMTECKIQADRDYVMDRIIAWHGSLDSLNTYVQTAFRERLQASLQVFKLPYCAAFVSTSLVLIGPQVDFLADVVWAQRQEGGLHAEQVTSIIIGSICGSMFFHATSIRLTMGLAVWISAPICRHDRPCGPCLELAYEVSCFLLVVAVHAGLYACFQITQQHGLLLICVTAVILAMLTWLVFAEPCLKKRSQTHPLDV